MFHWWCSDGLDGAVWGGLGWRGRGIRWYETEVFQAIEGEVGAIGSSLLLFMKDEKGAGQSNRSNLERITSAPRFEYGLSWHETAA